MQNLAIVLLAARRQARLAPLALDRGDHTEEEHRLRAEHIVAYRIDGPLFFAAAHRFLLELTERADVRVVVLRLSHMSVVDATGALVLKDAVAKLRRRGIAVMVSGIRPGHRQVLDSVGALDLLRHEGREYATTPEAIGAAREHLRTPPASCPRPGPRDRHRCPSGRRRDPRAARSAPSAAQAEPIRAGSDGDVGVLPCRHVLTLPVELSDSPARETAEQARPSGGAANATPRPAPRRSSGAGPPSSDRWHGGGPWQL
ncbi:hypothetical protein SHIRM173S_08697 [Streptomyces hirsutus]